MSTDNIGFYEDLIKISLNYHQISSKTHLISSAVHHLQFNDDQQNLKAVLYGSIRLFKFKNVSTKFIGATP